jgi:pimeloyl-ACP methyl ester carboxylesterase
MRSVLTRASAAIDRGALRFMERRMASRTPRYDPGGARTLLVELARAYSAGTLGHPSAFFPAPDAAELSLAPAGDGAFGTQIVDLAYRSGYVPFVPEVRDVYLSYAENLTAHARWWTSDRGRPTIVMLHGWGGGNYWLEERAFAVPYWLRHGYDVVVFQLPFHGRRGSGARAPSWPSPNPVRTNEGFGHAIYDLRALALALRARGATAVGAMGMSLGGYTTALWASIAGAGEAGGLDFAIAMIPAVSMARLMWRHGEASPARKRAIGAGITEELLMDVFAVHAPITRPVRVAHRFVIAGRGDRITPASEASELARHWGVDVAWFDGGHLAQLGRGEPLRAVRRALGEAGFAGRERSRG